MPTYRLPLNDALDMITDGLTELHRANAAEPYSHTHYEAAERVIRAGLSIITGDETVAGELREHLHDWSGENVGSWFIANYMTENNLKFIGPNYWTLTEMRDWVAAARVS